MSGGDKVFIIAEAGINHNGDLDLARQMIKTAADCGADCIKFQTFRADQFVSDPRQTYTYKSRGKEVTESMLEMFRRYEFDRGQWCDIIDYCRENGITFSSTAQNPSDLDFLLSLTDLPFIKVGSDDLTNLELISYYASKNKPMVISAGMAFAYEIEDAVRTIRECGNDAITVLHCVSSYPTTAEEVNLKKIPVIRDAFGVKVGFSDHTIGSTAALGSICLGAQVIEKHFTMDHDLPGPDHWFSITPVDLKKYIADIRFLETALGQSILQPTPKELEMRKIARRKVVAGCSLKAGETITIDKIAFKRHNSENALEPKSIDFILGRRLSKDLDKDQPVELSSLE